MIAGVDLVEGWKGLYSTPPEGRKALLRYLVDMIIDDGEVEFCFGISGRSCCLFFLSFDAGSLVVIFRQVRAGSVRY